MHMSSHPRHALCVLLLHIVVALFVYSETTRTLTQSGKMFSEGGTQLRRLSTDIGAGVARRLGNLGASQKEGSRRVYIAEEDPAGASPLDAMESGTTASASRTSDPHLQPHPHQLPQHHSHEHHVTMSEGVNHVPMSGQSTHTTNRTAGSSTSGGSVNAATAVTAAAVHKRHMSQKAIEYNNNIHVDNSAAGGGGVSGHDISTLHDVKKGGHVDISAVADPHVEEDWDNDGEDMVTVRGRRGRLIITVTDTGPGISTENQKRLFKEIVQFSPEKLQVNKISYSITMRLLCDL